LAIGRSGGIGGICCLRLADTCSVEIRLLQGLRDDSIVVNDSKIIIPFLVSRLAIMSISKLTEEQEQVQQWVGIIGLAIP
jgi:hypothetical protein